MAVLILNHKPSYLLKDIKIWILLYTPAKNKKKEIKEITPEIINARDLPPALPQPVHTLMSLNPQARRRITTKFTKKSKGGKKNKK
mgnify:CR=1 FL=1|jgi:hypothetical protein